MDTEKLRNDLELITGHRMLEEGDSMAAVLARLDASRKSSLIPERLQHYLSRRSYVKALAWLEDPSTPHHP